MLTQVKIAAHTRHLNRQTQRLCLRRLTPADKQIQIEHDLNRTIMAQVRDPLTREQAEQRAREMLGDWDAAEDAWLGLAIEERTAGQFVGLAFFRVVSYENQSVELGYRLHPDYWRRGYATEAVRALVEFLAETIEVRKLVAYCVAENEGSLKVLENLGFSREGCLKQHSWLDGRWQDELIFGRVLR